MSNELKKTHHGGAGGLRGAPPGPRTRRATCAHACAARPRPPRAERAAAATPTGAAGTTADRGDDVVTSHVDATTRPDFSNANNPISTNTPQKEDYIE